MMSILSKNKYKAFTLIELLVVIAIIGILSSVVLASLSGARNGAKDVAIKAEMKQMVSQAALYNQNHDGYYGHRPSGWSNDDVGQCFTTSEPKETVFADTGGLQSLGLSIHDKSQDAPSGSRVFCSVAPSSSPDSWAFAAPLNTPEGTTTGWCVDSSGASKSVSLNFNDSTEDAKLSGANGLRRCP